MHCFNNILVYVGSTDSKNALGRAFEIAKENGAKVTLMDVIKPVPSAIALLSSEIDPNEMERLLQEDRAKKLQELAGEFESGNAEVTVLVRSGDPAHEITRRVMRHGHDLVIKTADGESVAGQLFGSISRSLLRLCPCPVWLLKPQVHGDFDQILAAVDLDATDDTHRNLNDQLLQLASAIARLDNATLHVGSAWSLWMEQSLRRRAGDDEIDQAIRAQETRIAQGLNDLIGKVDTDGIEVQTHLVRGNAANEIFAVAEKVEADLIVMGTVCRTGVAGFLIGNTAENLLSNVTCSILAVKPDGFQSPVNVDDNGDSQEVILPLV
ncbi:universal stress protein [Roseiconus lacunae]|uniref:Universal stress protein n=1 Tax=Roseiconus lacunae TaxID=2605694 RepID=A0ABT7PKB3_9BACT|nr:universal stress protein [Roseiconus lacunae]MCD0461019.1 universal stress protein [Roseiconus lacunae]MDM4016923.1 universal stress protein [Roseiconus lacunae]WRQ48858.1 universal stress protein [Stieleria sp. HD01]